MFRPLRSNLHVRPCFAHFKVYSPLKYSQDLYHTLSFILILWRPVLSILLNLECLESKFVFFSLLISTTCHSYHVINRSIINTADIHWALTMCWLQYYSKCFTYIFFLILVHEKVLLLLFPFITVHMKFKEADKIASLQHSQARLCDNP